jgi:hypothetical protein
MSQKGLLDKALDDDEVPKGREVCDDLKNEPYITFHRGRGYTIKNNPDDQARIAFFLRDTCRYTEVQIEATLSRFDQKGGFDFYDSAP